MAEGGSGDPDDPDDLGHGFLARALAAIDAANADDPVRLEVDGESRPKEIVHAERMTYWVRALDPDADPAQLIAARSHHLRRWVVARSTFPDGRAGYLQWRVAQRKRQVDELSEILDDVGCPEQAKERALAILAKSGRTADPAVQTQEDALCLVFLELQADELAARLERDHMVEVLRKSVAKMSQRGIEAAGAIAMSDPVRGLLAEAVDAPRPA